MDFLNLIQEGRVDDFKNKFGQKFSPEMIGRIVSEITPKFLQWAGKVIDGVNFNDNFIKLSEALKKFEKISTNLPKTDINQYQTLEELITAITNYEGKSRRDIKKVEGGNVVYDDGNYFVVNPLNHDASCYYGKGTKWCTAAETDTHFKKYNEDGKLFYIIDRSKPTNDPLYKVALLRKFDGDKIYYDAKDEYVRTGWIHGTETLDKILNNVTGYLQQEFTDQLKIYNDKEAARKEKDRLEKLREQQRVQSLRNDAQDRRDENEWALDGNTPDEGLKAHALLEYLVDNEGVSILSNDDRIEIQRINDEIERLNNEYDADEELRGDLLDEISELEDELTELDAKMDVYDMLPTDDYILKGFTTTEFQGRWKVGDSDDTEREAVRYVKDMLDDVGYDGYNESFVMEHFDDDSFRVYLKDFFEEDVYNNYFYGSFNLDSIEKAEAGKPIIEVNFDFDKNRILTVTAKDLSTKNYKKEKRNIKLLSLFISFH